MAAIVVLTILATLCFPLLGHLRSRFESIKCKANLSGLGLGMNSYIADHKVWPQISAEKKQEGQDSSPVSSEAQSQAEKWIAVLAPYGISEEVWHCPTVQGRIKSEGSPEALSRKRIDYLPTRFDAEPESPMRWPKHPWFVERGSLHPTGPNVLFADGSILSLNELTK